jgi:glutamine amidotransferase
MITLVNYGLGNIQAFVNIYKKLDIPVTVAQTTADLLQSKKIILPGVGAFDWAMARLNDSGMRQTLDDLVLIKKIPILGVCVGMQIMAQKSDEGNLEGLGWIEASVKRFPQPSSGEKTYLPHMGWNDVTPKNNESLFKGMSNPQFYFLHSYFFLEKDQKNILSITNYHGQFTSAVQKDNIFGTQFHPEKSHGNGIQLLKNFADL